MKFCSSVQEETNIHPASWSSLSVCRPGYQREERLSIHASSWHNSLYICTEVSRTKVVLTSIGVCFWAVSILQARSPRSLVLRVWLSWLPYTVTPFRSLSPLSSIDPPSPRLHAQTMPLPVLPLALICTPTEIKRKKNQNQRNYSECCIKIVIISSLPSFPRRQRLCEQPRFSE